MFIFQVNAFADIVRRSDRLRNGNYRLYISKSVSESPRWYVRRLSSFEKLEPRTVIDVTEHYRNFSCLG